MVHKKTSFVSSRGYAYPTVDEAVKDDKTVEIADILRGCGLRAKDQYEDLRDCARRLLTEIDAIHEICHAPNSDYFEEEARHD